MKDEELQVENDWFYGFKPLLSSKILTWASLHSCPPLPALFFSLQDFSVWWGQIPPQRVHRGNANPPQEVEAQPNQKLQQLPGETVTCESSFFNRIVKHSKAQEQWSDKVVWLKFSWKQFFKIKMILIYIVKQYYTIL